MQKEQKLEKILYLRVQVAVVVKYEMVPIAGR